MRRKRQGFTLTEVVLVMAILVILAALAVPFATGMLTRSQHEAGVDATRAQLVLARNRAIEERRAYRFAVKDGTVDYRLAPNYPEFWNDELIDIMGEPGQDGDKAPLVKEGQIIRKSGKLEFGPVEDGLESNGEWRTVAVFLPDGSTEQNNGVCLRWEGRRSIAVNIHSITGSITTAPLAALIK